MRQHEDDGAICEGAQKLPGGSGHPGYMSTRHITTEWVQSVNYFCTVANTRDIASMLV